MEKVTNYQKAQTIIKRYEEKTRVTATCLKAGICPICGNPLKLVMEECIIPANKIKILFWFYTIQKEKKSEVAVINCPNKCDLGIGYNPGYIGYEDCANFEIRKYCINNSCENPD
jgi:hypothetical protein